MAGKGSVKLSIYSTFDDGGTKKAERAIGAFTKKYGSITDTGNGAMMSISGTTRSLLDQSIQADAAAAKWDAYSAKLDDIGGKMTLFATVPLVAAGAAAFNVAADFESSMSRVSGALNDPTADMDALRQMALDMGADTIFSASQSGAAMESLAKGGLSAAQIQGGALATTMDLAAAGNLDLAVAADTVVRSMGAFEMTAEESGVAANALAGAAAASSSDVADLSQGLAQCSAQANNAGWDIQNTTATLAAFADAGIIGSDAGTSLKTMLQRLSAPTDEAAKVMEGLGLNVRDGNGQMLDAAGIAEELSTKMGGLSSAEKDAALMKIFGSDASRAALVMTNQGRAGIEKYTAATNDQSAAQRLADSQMGESERALEEMKGAAESAAIEVGTALIPAVTDAANIVGDAAEAFSAMSDEEKAVVMQTLAAVAALGPLLLIGGKVAGVVRAGYQAYALYSAHLAKFSTGSRAASVSAKLLNTAVGGLGAGLGALAVVGAVGAISNLTYAFTDSRKEATASVNALASVGDSMTSFGDRMAAARPLVSDFNATFTSTGHTIGEVSGIIAEKEVAITEIIRTALSEQRGLRDEDIAAIQEYNAEIERLQSEKVQAYQSGMQGIADSVAAEGQINADRAAEMLATNQGYYDSAKSDLDAYHTSKLQSLNHQFTVEKTMTADEYNAALAQENDYYNQSKAGLDQSSADTRNAIAQHTTATAEMSKDTIATISETKDKLNGLMRLGDLAYLNSDVGAVEDATNRMAKAFSSLATEGNSSFLAMQLTIAGSGQQITAENGQMIDTLLSQFENLPPEIGDAGDKAMRALAEGMDSQLGIDVANSTAQQIVDAYRAKIPGAKAAGNDTGSEYAKYIAASKDLAVAAALDVTGMTIEQFNASAAQAGVEGDEAVAAYANSLANGATASSAAAIANATAATGGLATGDGATPGTNIGAAYSGSVGAQAWNALTQASGVAGNASLGLGTGDGATPGGTLGGAYATAVGDKAADANTAGTKLATNADSGAGSTDGSSAGSNFGSTFASSISGWWQEVCNAAASLGNAAKSALDRALGINSPSKEAQKSAKWYALGFIGETERQEANAYAAGYSFASAALEGADAAGSAGYAPPTVLAGGARWVHPPASLPSRQVQNRPNYSMPPATTATSRGDTITYITGNINITAKELRDVKTIDEFVKIVRRAKSANPTRRI